MLQGVPYHTLALALSYVEMPLVATTIFQNLLAMNNTQVVQVMPHIQSLLNAMHFYNYLNVVDKTKGNII